MLLDFALAVRTLVKRPGYALSVIVTLALGIGASVMMFSLLDGALLRPLPFHRSERLVSLTGVAGPERDPRGASFPEIADWRALNATLDDVVVYDEGSLNLRVGAEAIRVDSEMVSAGYFRLLGVSAALGRTFLPEEDAVVDRHPVVVISDRLWRRRFGADRSVLQRTVSLNDRAVEVIGVMPAGFTGLSFDTDVWVPGMMVTLANPPAIVESRSTRWLQAFGRLKDGVTLEQAQEDLTRVAGILESRYPQFNRERGVQLTSVREALVGSAGNVIVSLFAAVLLFLLVACANVASLQLARATSRRRELAVRLALGARRWHVLRQLLAESFVLSTAAGAAGAIAAAWGLDAAVALMPPDALPRHLQPAVEPRAIAFTIGVSLVVAVLVAILPARAAWRRDLADALKAGARSAEPGLGSIRRPSAQQALVVGEIALAVVLLVSAGLMVRSLQRQLDVRLGFEPAGITTGRLDLPPRRYTVEQRTIFVERLDERLRRVRGVGSVAIGSDLPFVGGTTASRMLPDTSTAPDAAIRYFRHIVSPGYFETLGVPILRGRPFTPQDRQGAPLVAIVSESAARRIWGSVDAVGRRFYQGSSTKDPVVEIVGVVGDVRFRDLTTDLSRAGAAPDVYFPYGQRTDLALAIAIRASEGALPPINLLQAAVSEIDAGLPFYQARTLADAVGRQMSTARFSSALLTMFSGGALLLSSVGLYGLLAYITSLSRREIAIRLALGASARRVTTIIVRNGLTLVVIGLTIGAGAAVAAARALATQLFQTPAADPSTFGAVALLLLAVTSIASLLPTRRAVRVDLQTTLRD